MKTERMQPTFWCLAALTLFLSLPVLALPTELPITTLHQAGAMAIQQVDTPDTSRTVATVSITSSTVTWNPRVSFDTLILTISAPDGEVYRQEFKAGTMPSFSTTGNQNGTRVDGQYRYELRVAPLLAPGVREMLSAASDEQARHQLARELRQKGLLPKEDLVQSGTFKILHGSFVSNELPESRGLIGSGGAGVPTPSGINRTLAPTDQVIPDDLIVQMSLCVGFDCVNNENFGFDTIRLKENNTRIKFEDTSTGTFPSTDWQLTANDSASGGANQFSIEDVTSARVPFLIEGGATTNSIYVDSTGRVGFRTSTPVLDLHVNTNNTPGMRLEQNSSGGFQAQTWDVAGNEANFFIRDVTSGSRLPFRITPGAPTDSLIIKSDGKVGLGIFNPEQLLHVHGNVVIDGSIEIRDGSFSASLNKEVLGTREVLERLARVSVTTWKEGKENRIAPNFEELRAAFGLNKNSLVDVQGINLAAIKALQERLQQREAELTGLQQQNVELQQRLTELESRLKAIEARLTPRR